MQTRQLIAYALLSLLVAGLAFWGWLAVYNSDDRVRRRERRARDRAGQVLRHETENGEAGTPD